VAGQRATVLAAPSSSLFPVRPASHGGHLLLSQNSDEETFLESVNDTGVGIKWLYA